MTKRWTKFAALAIALMLMLSGCSMITVDQEMVNAEAVAEFKDGTISKGEYDEYMQLVAANYGAENVDQLIQMFAMYGLSADDLKADVLDMMVEERIVKAQAEARGLTTLTADEEATIKEEAQASYDEMVDYYTSLYEDGVISQEEAKQQAIDGLNGQGFTYEFIEEQSMSELWSEKLFDEITKDVTVTEERVQEAYEERVASDQETYADDLLSFEYAAVNGDPVAWIPEGYRAVKHILIAMTDEQTTKLEELESALEDIELQLEDLAADDTADEPIEGEGNWVGDEDAGDEPAADEPTGDEPAEGDEPDPAEGEEPVEGDEPAEEDVPAEDEEPTMSKEELETQKALLTQQIADLKVEFTEALQPQVDAAMARVEAGEDFDALIEELGEDPGMETEPAKTSGYYVHANSEIWEPAFTKTAMELQAIGDVGVSEMSSSGIHIIKYIADVTPGQVALEDIRETIEGDLVEELKTEKYDELVAQWMEEADVKTYPDRL